jgi:hypothetical protein
MPSSRVQIDRTAAALEASKVNSGRTAPARSTNSATASSTASGGTRHTVSPGTPKGSRLVVSTATSGQDRSSSATTSAAPSRTCSQLSRQSSARRSRSSVATERAAPTRGSTGTPSVAATSSATSSGPVTASSSTHQTPSGHSAVAATCAASRVLPLPPGPASVTSRGPASNCRTWRTSVSRPTNPVSCTGRLFGTVSSERSGRGSGVPPSSKTRSGAVRSGRR